MKSMMMNFKILFLFSIFLTSGFGLHLSASFKPIYYYDSERHYLKKLLPTHYGQMYPKIILIVPKFEFVVVPKTGHLRMVKTLHYNAY